MVRLKQLAVRALSDLEYSAMATCFKSGEALLLIFFTLSTIDIHIYIYIYIHNVFDLKSSSLLIIDDDFKLKIFLLNVIF